MVDPTASYYIGPYTILLFGQQVKLSENPAISFEQAVAAGAEPDRVGQLIVASDASAAGHKLIVHDTYGISRADGILLSASRAAGVLQTADCPALILFDEATGKVVLAHAGRPALSPSGHCASCHIVNNAVHALAGQRSKETVHALVVGTICGPCFKHDHEEAKPLIVPFLNYPDEVFADRSLGALDLYQVIRHLLIHGGVPENNIHHEGSCTLENTYLSSHRRGDQTRNTIIVACQQ